MNRIVLGLFFILISVSCHAQQDFLQVELFPSQEEHAHGATIVELANGDMLAAWFQGHGERWADDVRIMGARLHKGETKWGKSFLMADVPGFPDINPVLFIDKQETLWLVWYTVIANQWETSLPRYRISKNYMQNDGPPEWKWQDVIIFKPGDKTERGIQPGDKFVKSVVGQMKSTRQRLKDGGATNKQLARFDEFAADIISKAKGENMVKKGKVYFENSAPKDTVLGYPYFRRLGWQSKNKPLQLGNKIILPFYSDGLEMSIMAITGDFGETWSFSNPLVGVGNIQPSMAIKNDGTIVAYMRDNGPPPQLHYVSESTDGGKTWSDVTDSEIVNPGSGSDVVTLANGNWVLAYNDVEDGRYSLAVSLSDDEGKTWKYTRHIETEASKPAKERSSFAYPSIIQGKDKQIHVIYSYHKYDRTETIKYIRFSEEWIKKGDN